MRHAVARAAATAGTTAAAWARSARAHAARCVGVGVCGDVGRFQRRSASDWASSQYAQLKSSVPDHILLMQVGNFYELYLEDAVRVNARLPLALSKKGMAGFPIHRKDAWIPQLQSLFSSVAVADQCDPGVSSTLSREIVRIFTPGTLLPEIDVEDDSPRHLTAIAPDNLYAPTKFGLCVYNNITGQLQFGEKTQADLLAALPGLDTVELLLVVPDLRDDACRLLSRQGMPATSSVPLSHTLSPLRCFQETYVMGVPQNWLSNDTGHLGIPLSNLERTAGNVVLNYLHRCYPKGLPTLLLPQESHDATQQHEAGLSLARTEDTAVRDPSTTALPAIAKPHLVIDADTRDSLNLTTPRGKGSLLHVVDKTSTAFGRRELRTRLANPITSRTAIERRLDLVEYFYEHHNQATTLQRALNACTDPLRSLSSLSTRVSLDNTAVNLSKLCQFCKRIQTILSSPELQAEMDSVGGEQYGECLVELRRVIHAVPRDLFDCLEEEHDTDAHAAFPARGFDESVDAHQREVDRILDAARAAVAAVSQEASLVELPDGVLALHAKPRHIQQLGRSRSKKTQLTQIKRGHYGTPELESLTIALITAKRQLSAAQLECARRMCELVVSHSHLFETASRVLAHLDVSAALARTASLRQYVRPTITNGVDFHVVQGRHAILDALSADDLSQHFRPNDCEMDVHKSLIITGPNMGGKSTFLRQNALIVVLAQMGSFVPADECTIGVVDRLFSRVGAQDNQVEGKSTFLVEMEETANIVNNATPRSFVVMDEVGRGTNSSEGLALAVAISRRLAAIGCRSMSVTHHLQLPALCKDLDNVGVYKFVAEKDEEGRILFHHSIQPGIADDAHAVEVATFAGHPPEVTDMALLVLESLQQQQFGRVDPSVVQEALNNSDHA